MEKKRKRKGMGRRRIGGRRGRGRKRRVGTDTRGGGSNVHQSGGKKGWMLRIPH